ncbi:ABC-type transport auxiliary lipoprotein family protein [Rhizobium sp. 3T7]|uniref:ABC-type transport auxiliary lipoprotein family protein n=1 Tax=Rhizobium sp. 3T7 TaxID=2874922 RepID=UPI001CCAD2B7|nr:ABC-type transport auxiliary lipoprotein family protein [Rhizobium sp. 3T7]MBZ9788906.1 ABC-type transport auxiliary lipoprotein family protein [Rhizobium sp. 3T7]
MAVSDVLQRRSWVLIAAIALPLLAGLAGCGTTAKNDTYDLSASATGSGPAAKGRQILVQQPTALKAIDSEQIVIRVAPSQIQYLSKAQWGDKLPRMVQAKLVEAYENSGKLGGVGVPGQGLAIDYQLVTDIRSFEIDTTGGSRAVVEISAKILNDRNGSVRAQKVFRQEVSVDGSNDGLVKGLDRAFAGVSAEIVNWTLQSI